VESLISARLAQNTLPLIATGGIQNANHIMTSLMLGANLASSAGFMLQTLVDHGESDLTKQIIDWQQALPRLFTLLGAKNIAELQQSHPLYSDSLQNFISQQKKRS
ncbi:MAG: alpha-hydroxy-acid oxidizing protein, partial [Leuconostoc falkenbergense]